MKETVYLYFITGFLGSGKTTFLKEILNMLPKEKVGLIVNEFGQINVDGQIITTDSGYEVVEINNGQVFCGCVSGNFVDSICEYLTLPIRHLIVETSGMANPHNIQDILANVENRASEDYEYKGMICIVDPTKAMMLVESLNAVRSQISKSEFLVINKADLVTKEELEEVQGMVAELNPTAPVLVTSFGKIDEEMFLSFLKGEVSRLNAQVQNIEQSILRPLNYLLAGKEPVPYEKLVEFSKRAAKLSYRYKGYANTDRGVMLVSGLDTGVNYTPSDYKIEGFDLVLISSEGDIKDEIEALWQAYVGTALQISEKGKEYWD
ncbi:GTP-binding protein [Clostridia bacterium]|nr:GTP-binding protein [Clostridia bacterium]